MISLLPLRVLPHAHALVDADRITDDDLAELQTAISSYTGDSDNPVEIKLTPKVYRETAEPLSSQQDLFNVLSYFNKAINVVKPYHTAWNAQVATGGESAFTLNREARELLEGIPVLLPTLKGQSRKRSNGTFHRQNGNFIGTILPSKIKKKPKKRKRR